MGSILAIGLMSDLDRGGVDAALIDTDGNREIRPIGHVFTPFADGAVALFAEAVALAQEMEQPLLHPVIVEAEAIITSIFHGAVQSLLRREAVERETVEIIGVHGQMLAHRPERYWSWQLGDAEKLAELVGIDVVSDFRSEDIKVGGKGDPITPAYHRAVIATLDRTAAFLDLAPAPRLTIIGDAGAPQSLALPAAEDVATFAQAITESLGGAERTPTALIAGGPFRAQPALLDAIAAAAGMPVRPLDAFGWDGDATDAEAMAYLAMRRLAMLPIGFPGTTGAPYPVGGGVIHRGRFSEEEMLEALKRKR